MNSVFPELTIAQEDLKLKLKARFGATDINFESAEFSKAFWVRSPNKKFAYDICHPQMMEYLLMNRDLNIEVEKDTLALVFENQLSATKIEFNLQRLLEIRSRLPEYLFTKV